MKKKRKRPKVQEVLGPSVAVSLDAAGRKREEEKRLVEARQAVIHQLSECSDEELQKLHSISFIYQATLHNSPPKTYKELHEAIRAYTGYAIPYVACSEDTHAPMQWIGDLFFGKVSNSMSVGNRGSGKTAQGSALHFVINTFFPNSLTTHAGANLNQASVASGYLERWSKADYSRGIIDPRAVSSKNAKWKNGSRWYVVTGNGMESVSGHHPHKATWDEIEFWETDALEQTWAVPKATGDYGASNYRSRFWAAFSTRQRGFGAANWLVENAAEKKVVVYKWNVFETMRPCRTCVAIDKHPHGNDAQRESACMLWSRCKGIKGIKARGFQTLRQIHHEYGPMNADSRETQVFCERPSSNGVVFHMKRDAYNPDGNYTKWTYQKNRHYWIWFDPAEGKWSVMYFVQMDDSGRLYVFDELCLNPCQSTMVAKKALYDYCLEKQYDDPLFIVVDPRRTDAINDLRMGSKYGAGVDRKYLAVSPSMKNFQSQGQGGQSIIVTLSTTQDFVCDGYGKRRLFWNPEQCPRFTHAMKEYHYKTDNLGNVVMNKDSLPDVAWKDFIDPIRYGVQYYTQLPSKHMVAKVADDTWL